MESIYMDHAATTPVRPEVAEAMAPYLGERYGNASSAHGIGRRTRAAVEESRERIADAIGAARREIIFTGGGTEANNLAVLGRWRAARRTGGRAAVAFSAVEHSSVRAAAAAAADEGADAIVLGVDEGGRLDPGTLDEALEAEAAVVSVMWGNNEVGTVQPVEEVAKRCRAAGVAFHSDAVQAVGKVAVRVEEVACDLLAFTAHKLGGPQGVGALYVREGVPLVPLVHGGGQERDLRPGTEAVASIVGFATAVALAVAEREREAARLSGLRDRLEAALRERVPGLRVNAAATRRLPHILNVSVPGVDREAVLMALDLEGIAVSSGSACSSGGLEPSHVLTAMGRGGGDAAAIRFSLGRTTTEREIERAEEVLPAVVERIREQVGGLAR